MNKLIIVFISSNLLALTMLAIAQAGEKDMSQEECNVQQTNNRVEEKTNEQTETEILEYWTPERMQNAKPIMPTISEPPSSEPESNTQKPVSIPVITPSSEE